MLISPKDNNFYNFRSELILRLKESYRVILVCPYGSKIDYFTERGCEFINIDVDRRGTNLLNDFKLIYRYIKVIRKYKPDIVLTYTTKSGIYGGLACRLTRTKYISNNAGLIISEKRSCVDVVLDVLYRLGYNGASCMMFQNSSERDFFMKILRKGMRYYDIPGSGVNVTDFKLEPYPAEDEDIIFNFVARIVKFKGIDEYLECARRIKAKYSNIRFIIYGDYDNNDYRAIINDMVEQGIIEYGGIQMNMKKCIAKAGAVIHSSYYEGMTNVILEHGAMGRPSIASNVPGCKEGVSDGETGYLFECKNVDMLTEKVEQLINLPYGKRKEMGLAARKKMVKEFNRNIVTDTYLLEINNLIDV